MSVDPLPAEEFVRQQPNTRMKRTGLRMVTYFVACRTLILFIYFFRTPYFTNREKV